MASSVIEQTATNLEILAGAGKAAEAQQLTKKLLSFDSSPATHKILEQHLAAPKVERREAASDETLMRWPSLDRAVYHTPPKV